MFYTYIQNNSGGSFEVNEDIKQYVIIEADSAEEANDKAEDLGIYFDGVEKGFDCPCCGNRWHKCDEEDGTKDPLIWGQSPIEYLCGEYVWSDTQVIVYYKTDGKVVYRTNKEK